MIIRPGELKITEVDLMFNFQPFEFLEIDLPHVNKNERSNYDVDEVAFLVRNLVNGFKLVPSDEKEFGEEICSYFVKTGEVKGKKYKLVFCICSDRPTSIGVITLHRIRGE